jgi:hypothetical protein
LRDLVAHHKDEQTKWSNEYTKTQRRVSRAIIQEKADLGLRRKEIVTWEGKIAEKKREIQELKQQMSEVKENQAQLANLKMKLRDCRKNGK